MKDANNPQPANAFDAVRQGAKKSEPKARIERRETELVGITVPRKTHSDLIKAAARRQLDGERRTSVSSIVDELIAAFEDFRDKTDLAGVKGFAKAAKRLYPAHPDGTTRITVSLTKESVAKLERLAASSEFTWRGVDTMSGAAALIIVENLA